MDKNFFNIRMLTIRNEELKVDKDNFFKILKELVRKQEENRQLLLYIKFLEEKIIDLNNQN